MMGDNIVDGEEGQCWGEEEWGTHKDRGTKEEVSRRAKQHNNQTVRRRGVDGDGEELRRAVLRVEAA